MLSGFVDQVEFGIGTCWVSLRGPCMQLGVEEHDQHCVYPVWAYPTPPGAGVVTGPPWVSLWIAAFPA